MTTEQENKILKAIETRKSGDWGCIEIIIIWIALMVLVLK